MGARVPMNFFHGCVIALGIEAATVTPRTK
jgi:hypothetical protein